MSLPSLGGGAAGLGDSGLKKAESSTQPQKPANAPIILPNPAALLMGQKASAGAIQIAKPPASKNFASALFGAGGSVASAPGAIKLSGLAMGTASGSLSRTGAGASGASAAASGEIIADSYHKYNSISNQAPLVHQDEGLSYVLNSRNAKIFMNPD